MPYRRNTYDFVIDSSFQPFTMQEMLVPFTAYKDAFEKSEEAYNDLSTQADKFKYLSETLPEGSKARQIYEGYANDLKAQAIDLANNGLNMGNRRALTGLKRRFQGEIGRLIEADTALKKEQELRRQMSLKDPSMLYGENNLNIDSYLDGNTPNLYSISGNELYSVGVNLGRALSSREYKEGDAGSVLGGYYRDWVSEHGVSPKSIADFMASDVVKNAIQSELNARGAYNLQGTERQRAEQNLVNGFYEGIVYEISHKPMPDAGVLTKAQEEEINLKKADDRRAEESMRINALRYGYRKGPNNEYVSDDEWMYDHDENGIRTGMSQRYYEEAKKAQEMGVGLPGAPSSRRTSSTKTTTQKPSTVQLKSARKYTKGSVSSVTNSANTVWGEPISYEEAIKIDPEVEQHHPGYEQYYEYFKKGKTVTVKPKSNTIKEYEKGASDAETNSEIDIFNDDNQL